MLAEARWLGEQGVRELFLVSENSTSYGKDLGDLRLLERSCPTSPRSRVWSASACPTSSRPRPGPGLVTAIAATPGVAPYFDLSFQHASGPLLRRMRRFGDSDSFLALLEQIRAQAPEAGVRSNFIVGFPGETEDDLATLCSFLEEARLDAIGVFGYSDEDGTEAASYDAKLDDDEVRDRVEHVTRLVEELTAQRAEDRIGEQVVVLVESVEDDEVVGRAAHQGPEVDGSTYLSERAAVGDLVRAEVVGTDGVDSSRRPRTMNAPIDEPRPAAVSNWNVPNALTTLRIVMVPFFGWALLHDGGDSNAWRWVAWVLFVVAMITDKIDGDLARKHNLITNFGKIADPIADKAMTGMAFIGLSIIGELWWWVTIVVLIREWAVTIARLSIAKHVVIAASQSGKLKTLTQAFALGGFIGPFKGQGRRPSSPAAGTGARRRGVVGLGRADGRGGGADDHVRARVRARGRQAEACGTGRSLRAGSPSMLVALRSAQYLS